MDKLFESLPQIITAAAQSNLGMLALLSVALSVLAHAARDPGGLILYEKFGGGVDFHTNSVSLVTSNADHQALARWEAALEQLTRQGLLKARGTAGEIWEVTDQGYTLARRPDVASALPAQSAAPRNPP